MDYLGVGISIPAFREEGDRPEDGPFVLITISIPAFREEGDQSIPVTYATALPFQSPPSVRKATISF